MNVDRAPRPIFPLSSQTIRNILDEAREMWNSERAELIFDDPKAAAATSPTTETAPAAKTDGAPKSDAKPAPKAAKKGELTRRSAAGVKYYFVSEPGAVVAGANEPVSQDAGNQPTNQQTDRSEAPPRPNSRRPAGRRSACKQRPAAS